MIKTIQEAQQAAQELMTFMMDKRLRRCLCCESSLSKSDHVLTKGMVNGLIKFAKYSLDNQVRYVRPRIDLRWAYKLELNEASNWTKLRFFGLVAKHMVNGKHTGGKWVVTRNGWAFLRGQLPVPAHVKTFRNRIVEKSVLSTSYYTIMGSDTSFPSHSDFYADTVTGDDLEAVKAYDAKKKRGKATGRACPMCTDGTMRNKSTDEIIEKDGVKIAVVEYFAQCDECEFRALRD